MEHKGWDLSVQIDMTVWMYVSGLGVWTLFVR